MRSARARHHRDRTILEEAGKRETTRPYYLVFKRQPDLSYYLTGIYDRKADAMKRAEEHKPHLRGESITVAKVVYRYGKPDWYEELSPDERMQR
jgi:hypothetical protein